MWGSQISKRIIYKLSFKVGSLILSADIKCIFGSLQDIF